MVRGVSSVGGGAKSGGASGGVSAGKTGLTAPITANSGIAPVSTVGLASAVLGASPLSPGDHSTFSPAGLLQNGLQNGLWGERYLNYQPALDERYQPPEGLLGTLTLSRLWLSRNLPFTNPQYKGEYTGLTQQLNALPEADIARWGSPAVAGARQLLENTQALLGQNPALSPDGWLTVSHLLRQFIAEDWQSPDAQELQGLFKLLQDAQCRELHGFLVTAYHQQANQPQATLACELGTLGRLLHHASGLMLDNACLHQLRQRLLKQTQPQTLPQTASQGGRFTLASTETGAEQGGWVLSSRETALLWAAVNSVETLSARQELQSRLFRSVPQLDDLKPDSTGQIVLYPTPMLEETRLALSESLTREQKANQQVVQAILAFVQTTLVQEPALKAPLLGWLLAYIQAHPSGPVVAGLLGFMAQLTPDINEVETALNLLDAPALTMVRLVLAQRLAALCAPYPALELQLKARLEPYGLNALNLQTSAQYDAYHWRGLKRRLEARLIGQEALKSAWLEPFKLWAAQNQPAQATDTLTPGQHTPLLLLQGEPGSGKTYVAGILAQELNRTASLEEFCVNPELWMARPNTWGAFNAFRVDVALLAQKADLHGFKVALNQAMQAAHRQAKQQPGKPLVLMFDHTEALGDAPDTPVPSALRQLRDTQTRYMLAVLQQLKQRRLFSNPFTGEMLAFGPLWLVLGYNPLAFAHLEFEPDSHPLLKLDKATPAGQQRLLLPEAVVPLSLMNRQELGQWVQYQCQRQLPLQLAARGYATVLQAPLQEELSRYLHLKQLAGHASLQHWYRFLIQPLQQLPVAVRPQQVTVSLDANSLKANLAGRAISSKLYSLDVTFWP